MERKDLFDPVELPGLKLKNRLVRSATLDRMTGMAGEVGEAHVRQYERLARGGVGLIVTGNSGVSDGEGIFMGLFRLSRDELIDGHARLVQAVHEGGCPVLAQLVLMDYTRDSEWNMTPEALTPEDIERVETLFAAAAARAEQAGYDGVQVHLAHGFFLSRFVSPLHNRRTDGFGGSTEKRAKLPCRILSRIRAEHPGLHLSVKVNSTDCEAGGLEAEESLALCRLYAEAGAQSIEVSGNDPCRTGIRPGAGEAYYALFAGRLAEQVNVPVILTGGHRSMEHMEQVLNESGVACLGLSRPLISEPELPLRWQAGDTRPSRCISCNRCLKYREGCMTSQSSRAAR